MTFSYVVRRVLTMFLVLLGISLLTFALLFIIPADPARVIAGPHAGPLALAHIRANLGLNRPIYVQYGLWLWRALHGNLGTSFAYKVPVLPSILVRLPATAELAAAGLVAELIIGIPVGLVAAVWRGSVFDRVLMSLSLLGITAPGFWLGLFFIYLFGFKLGIFPLGGIGGLWHLVLPAATIGLGGGAWYARLLRSTMLDQLDRDYVRTATAKGAGRGRAVLLHALPNALAPVVTQIGLDLGSFLSGVLIIEIVFGWPGLGTWAWTAVQNLDYPVIVGTVIVSATLITLANLVVDLLYPLLDKRVSLDSHR